MASQSNTPVASDDENLHPEGLRNAGINVNSEENAARWARALLSGTSTSQLPLPRGDIDKSSATDNESAMLTADRARKEISEEAIAATGIQLDDAALVASISGEQFPVQEQATYLLKKGKVRRTKARSDIFSILGSYPELFMELAKHLPMKAFVSLYAISKDFHETINGHLSHIMRACAEHQAPESAKLFLFTFYEPLCIPDPAGRAHPLKPDTIRKAPSLRWLQMVVHREKTVRDILACMARQGHRMPDGMSLSLKKMWLLMDISTSARRVQFMHSKKFFTDLDLFHIQMFIVKLDMRFNDPIDGPGDDGLRKLFLGQKGLTPLSKALKRTEFTSLVEIVKLALRYAYDVRPEHRNMPIWDIPAHQIGIGHLEGWGAGRVHLCRPDELVMRESVRRRLGLKNHIMGMMLWGYIDPISGLDIKVTDEEMYMSGDEDRKTKDPNWSDYEECEEYSTDADDEDDEGNDVTDTEN